MNNKSLNPFKDPSTKEITPTNAIQEAESQRAIQEVQAALVIAKKFPRNQVEAMDRILNACTRSTLANTALYSYPRGGTEVTGPSIRLAEAMAQSWGNLDFGIRELSSSNGVSTVEAFAWDLETNTRQVKIFQVPHMRYTRANGNKPLTDPRDIYELIANNGARRLRACILGVIPGDVTEAAVDQCHVTQKSNVDVTPESIGKMTKAFEEFYGVTTDHIQLRLQKRVEAINASQFLSLKKIFQSLKDGMSKPADWFDMANTEISSSVASTKINDQLEKAKTQTTQKEEPHGGDKVEPEQEQAVDKSKPLWIFDSEHPDDGYYMDHYQEMFDENQHAKDEAGIPSMNATGAFRKKRKPAAKAEPKEASTQQNEAVVGHSEAYTMLSNYIDMANDLGNIEKIVGMDHWSKLYEGEAAKLQEQIEKAKALLQA